MFDYFLSSWVGYPAPSQDSPAPGQDSRAPPSEVTGAPAPEPSGRAPSQEPAPKQAQGAPAPGQDSRAPPSEVPGAPAPEPAAWEPSGLFAECPSFVNNTLGPVLIKASPPSVLPGRRGRSTSPEGRGRSSSPPQDLPQDGRGRRGGEKASPFPEPPPGLADPPWKDMPARNRGKQPPWKSPPANGQIKVPYKHKPPMSFKEIPEWCHFDEPTGPPGTWNVNDWVRFVNQNLEWFSYPKCNGFDDLEWWFHSIRTLQKRPVPNNIILPRWENPTHNPWQGGGGGGGSRGGGGEGGGEGGEEEEEEEQEEGEEEEEDEG